MALISVLLLLVIPLFAHVRQASVPFFPGWGWLIFGLFAQAGIAEEILFRGYLFGYLRRRRSFWQAALLATGPFVVHLLLFVTLPWPIALAALFLAVALSFPIAHLFEPERVRLRVHGTLASAGFYFTPPCHQANPECRRANRQASIWGRTPATCRFEKTAA